MYAKFPHKTFLFDKNIKKSYANFINSWEEISVIRVLVIDDEMRTREGIRRYVNWDALGVDEVLFLENAKDAIQKAETEEIRLVLTDIRMPGMDGIEFARQMKKMQPECDIIFISAYSDIEYLKAAIRLRAIDYVEKPLDVDELESAISKALHKNQPAKDEKIETQYMGMLRDAIFNSTPLKAQAAAENAINGMVSQEWAMEDMQAWCVDAVKMMMKSLFDVDMQHHQLEEVNLRIGSAEMPEQLVRTLCQMIVVFMIVGKRSELGQPIKSTLMHIALKLDDPEISVSTLAKKVFITPNYLSALFSRETGETINHFVLHARMVMAKYFLQDPRLKRYEIAKMVGLKDVNYFSKLFKKITGISPSEYIAAGTHNHE